MRDAVLDRLLQVYSGHSRNNHRKLADEFNAAAKDFTAAAAIVSPDAAAVEMVTAPEDQRQAWSATPALAARLDALVPVIAAAAALGGVDTRRDEAVLPLVVDPAGAHRRRVWEAWAAKGRAGRWSAIIACGALVHAGPLDQVTSYRRPKPIEHVRETRDGFVTTRAVDPEDPVVAAAEDVVVAAAEDVPA